MKKVVWVLMLWVSLGVDAAGDAVKGAEKAVICAACHGALGVSSVPLWPNLAGQHAGYLAKQLRDYQAGTARQAEVMQAIASSLTEQEREDLAAFYSRQAPSAPTTERSHSSRGEQLYRQGDTKQHITACIACHGPHGDGNAGAGFPVIRGQQEDYTVTQLLAFKHHTRQNDLNAIMRSICKHMNEADMQALAAFLQTMPAR